jgi:thiol:disulfide interchange protein DsbD
LPIYNLLLLWDILQDYYLYDNRMQFNASNDIGITEISRSPSKTKDDPLFGKVDVYYQSSEIILQFNNVANKKNIDLQIVYQGCWDGGVCYPPVTEKIVVKMLATDSEILNNVEDSVDATVKESSIKGSASKQDYFSKLLVGGDFLWIVSAFFIAGLALSLTPCVFPMIPIISSIIAGQGTSVTKYKAFILTLIYVLAVSVTYTIAGVLAGLFGENLQIVFQQPWIIILFSIIFVLLALSMFGFYQLQLPSSLQSRLSNASHQQRGGSYLGVAIMGFLSALIVGPCMAAPLAGALIYIGQTADPLLGGTALFALSLGMGVPLIIVGVSAGHFLPKVGPWMNAVKASFGVMLILMAIYLLDRIVSLNVSMLLTGLTLITSGVFLGGISFSDKTSSGAKLCKAIALVILVYGLSLLLGTLIGKGNFLQPLKGLAASDDRSIKQANTFQKVTSIAQLSPILNNASAQNQPVLLDFYANWCISCVEIEYMLEEPEVVQALKTFRLVKVDLTDFNQEAQALLAKYQVLGPPALVFYNAKGDLESAMNILGLVDSESFLRHITPLK